MGIMNYTGFKDLPQKPGNNPEKAPIQYCIVETISYNAKTLLYVAKESNLKLDAQFQSDLEDKISESNNILTHLEKTTSFGNYKKRYNEYETRLITEWREYNKIGDSRKDTIILSCTGIMVSLAGMAYGSIIKSKKTHPNPSDCSHS